MKSEKNSLTGARLLALHNLVYLEQLVQGARKAIQGQRFPAYARAVLQGAAPWDPVSGSAMPVADPPG